MFKVVQNLDGSLVISGVCVVTGDTYSVAVPLAEWTAWQVGGERIQDAMPSLSAGDREFLLSGISPMGWDSWMAAAHRVAANGSGEGPPPCRAARTEEEHDLVEAARMGRAEDVARLLAGGTSPHVRGGLLNETPLQAAARSGSELAVAMLLEAGADVDAADDRGGTALERAVRAGHTAVVKLLLRAGADADGSPKARTAPIAWAADLRDVATVRCLLEAGADIQYSETTNGSVVHVAVRAGSYEVLDALLDAGADPYPPGCAAGETALDMAVVRVMHDIVRRLAELQSSALLPVLKRLIDAGLVAKARRVVEALPEGLATECGITAEFRENLRTADRRA